MKVITRHIIILSLLLSGISTQLQAQRLKATATLDSANIRIGDQVKLFLQLDKPKGAEVEFPQVGDTISSHIEVLKRSGIDTFKTDDENLDKLIQTFTITCFDTGYFEIPKYRFKFNVDGWIDSTYSNNLMLHVFFEVPIDTTRGPTDIKMPYDAPLTLKEVTPYILGVILIGAILFFILYSIKRRKQNKPIFSKPAKPKEPPHIIAIRELDRIKAEKLWQKDKIKLYYSEVTETLRKYIEDRFGIPAMEQTSDETISMLRYRRDLITEKAFNNLKQILSLADMVKFAKYKPLPDDNNLTLINAYFFVNETKKEEIVKSGQPDTNQGGEEVNDGEEVNIK